VLFLSGRIALSHFAQESIIRNAHHHRAPIPPRHPESAARQRRRAHFHDGRTVEYRGTAEISHAIAELEREIAVIEGKAPFRRIRVFTSKGL
jgi:hypothetical protein